MGIPRPDTNEVKDIIETQTGLHWETNIDEPDKLSFINSVFTFDIVWDGSKWTFRLYDHASPSGLDEPKWAQGPMHNATEVKNELPGFIPTEICRH